MNGFMLQQVNRTWKPNFATNKINMKQTNRIPYRLLIVVHSG